MEGVHAVIRAARSRPATGVMTKQPKTKTRATPSLPRQSQAILDTMQLGVTQANAEGEILYANPAVAEMHGYTVAELVGSNLSIFEASVEQEPTIAGWSEGSTSWTSERVHKRKDGGTLFVRALSDVISGSAGGTIVTGYEDITERRQAEDALREQHERESRHAALHDPLTGLPNKPSAARLDRSSVGTLQTPQRVHVRGGGFEPRSFPPGQRWPRAHGGGSAIECGVGATEAVLPIGRHVCPIER
jgi:PAS domain S-box-containing protein